MRSVWSVLAVASVILLGVSQLTLADPAIGVSGGTIAPPGGTTNHGWEFTANSAITVTNLGLWDDNGDGNDIAHPIGLWELSSGTLLASGTISAGASDPLIDGFRYVDVTDVVLTAGVHYVVGWYSASSSTDRMVYDAPVGFWTAPEITYVQACYGPSGSFVMPHATTTTRYYRIGPNFQFTPEPGTACLLLVGGVLMLVRRRG
jgi:hypothetical protein